MAEERQCEACGESLRFIEKVGYVHYSQGAYRLCANPPEPKSARQLQTAIEDSKPLTEILKAAVKRPTA